MKTGWTNHVRQENSPLIGLFITQPTDRRLLVDFLEGLGYGVIAGLPSGVPSREWAKVSLILTDERAAHTYGKEFQRLKEQAGGTFLPILLLLLHNAESKPWREAGFDDILRMPFHQAELQSRLQTYLDIREQAQEQYREIFEHAPIGIFRAAADGQLLLLNPAMLQALGYSSLEELQASSQSAEFYAAARIKALLESAVASDGVEVPWLRRNGAPLVVRLKARMLRGADGTVRYYQATLEDITAQRRALEGLRESEERFRSVWESTADAMAISDRDGIVLAANPAYYRLYQLEPEQVLYKKFFVIFPETFHRAAMEQYREVFEHAREQTLFESVVRRGDGTERTVETYIDFLADNGQRVAMLSSIRDITERKQAEQQLRQANEELERRVAERTAELHTANQELHQHTQTLVQAQEVERRRIAIELHDQIGQDLTAVMLNLSLLGDLIGDVAAKARLEESSRVTGLAIDQVRTLAFDLRPDSLEFAGLVPALQSYLEQQAKQAQLTIDFRADPAANNLPRELRTICFRITQEAITNVVRHARAKKVWVELRRGTAELDLGIRDDGIGFDVTAAQQAPEHKFHLGLLGMHERAELLKGKLQVRSNPGAGTEIHARFPLGDARGTRARGRRRKTKGDGMRGTAHGIRPTRK